MNKCVIYKVINKINGKIYIGQSIHYNKRKTAHLSEAKRNVRKTPFHNTIRKYGKENFQWEIVCEVSREYLNNLELFYIIHFNSICPNGYNLSLQGVFALESNYHPNADPNIYEFYNIYYGIVKCTQRELYTTYNLYSSDVNGLITNKYMCVGNWILYKNIDKYILITELYEFYHKDYNKIICKRHELVSNYNLAKNVVAEICNNKRLTYKGRMLYSTFLQTPELVSIYESSWGRTDRTIYLFLHPEHGIVKNTRLGLRKKYNLNQFNLNKLIRGECKTYKGWSIKK